jgi:acyl-CoA reductase-like NAD-dependent aldehyde dehydrogenase
MAAKVFKNFIGGEWVESRSGQTYENLNPADTRDVIGIFQRSDKRDVDDAVSANRHLSAGGWFPRPSVLKSSTAPERSFWNARKSMPA